MWATSGPNSSSILSSVVSVSSTTSCKSPTPTVTASIFISASRLATPWQLFLFCVFLAGFESFVEPLVGLSDKLLLFVFAVGQARFLSVEKVLVGHRIFVIRIEAESFVEVGKTLLDKLRLFLFR